MSDPRSRDPRLDPPPIREDELRTQRMNELETSNAMWGWVAGAVVLALVMVFIFTRGPTDGTSTASLPQPPASTTTGAAPAPNTPPPIAQAPKTEPSTTGQGAPRQ